MTNTPEQAIANARAQHKPGLFSVGMCLQRVRLCYGVGPKFLSASKAWAGAQHKHRSGSAGIPRGVPIFWVGGSSGFGHIAISLGDGLCESTDFVNRGGFGTAHIDDITRRWGLTFQGWTEDLNGVRVYTPPSEAAPERVDKETAYSQYRAALIAAGKKYGQHINERYTARRRLYTVVESFIKRSPDPAAKKKGAKK